VQLETLRSKGESGLQIFVVDKDEHAAKALEFDIVACPALCMFWKGTCHTLNACVKHLPGWFSPKPTPHWAPD
jgi:hypothetical protein